MEISSVEVIVLQQAAKDADGQVCELSDLQLALVGGGGGDVVFA